MDSMPFAVKRCLNDGTAIRSLHQSGKRLEEKRMNGQPSLGPSS